MIFITVGTHEQPFNRLIEYMDKLKISGKIDEEVIAQIGFSTYIPRHCIWERMLPYDQMEKNIAEARIIITHGGPASFIMPLRIGKIPIVVPRMRKYNEHVNDHQVEFVNRVAEKMGTIIPVTDIGQLEQTISDYDLIVARMNHQMGSNNGSFCNKFQQIVDEFFDEIFRKCGGC